MIRPETFVPRPLASSPLPRSRSESSSYLSPSADLAFSNLSSVPRFPVLVQVHQPPYLWKTATTGRHFHPSDPTPPPWEAERIRDTLARDLEYLERQVPPFLRESTQQIRVGPMSSPAIHSSATDSRFQDQSSSSGFHTGSKQTTTFTLPSGSSGIDPGLGSGASGGHEIFFRHKDLPDEPVQRTAIFSRYPPTPMFRSLPPRTYENWPRREGTPPIYAMARSPTFDVGETRLTATVPVSEASPGSRTLQDMSVDDPYEFDAVIPDTSPEIAYPSPPQQSSSSMGPATTVGRFRRTRDKYENMEARVAAMKEEFFEYRRRQKKRMESAC